LSFAGTHVGTGFNDETLAMLRRKLHPLRIDTSSFADKPPRHGETTWVRPELVAEVRFAEWTEGIHLRAPVFLRLRDDIDPKSVRKRDTWRDAAFAAKVLDTLDGLLETFLVHREAISGTRDLINRSRRNVSDGDKRLL
jgi:ATP-dependent DNA ligase